MGISLIHPLYTEEAHCYRCHVSLCAPSPLEQVNFVNPDSLGSLPTFERVMAAPINRSRDRNASEKEKELGATRSA